GERRVAPELDDVDHALLGRRDHRGREPGDHTGARRPDLDGDAGRRRRVPRSADLAPTWRRVDDRDRRRRRADEPRSRRGLGGTMAYCLAVKWTIKESELDAVLAALRPLAEASRQEPGCLLYQAHLDPEAQN